MRLYEYSVNHAVCVTRPVLASMTMNEAGVMCARCEVFAWCDRLRVGVL